METVVIGIDHGWSLMKTMNHTFVAGVKELSTEPALKENTVEFHGRYYKIGGQRLKVKDNKVLDDNYYILTLAAIAKELSKRNKGRKAKVILGVGLPLTRFGSEKNNFLQYLNRKKEIYFKYEGEHYNILLEKVYIFPQCYGAVIDRLNQFKRSHLVVDIGSWTIDIMPIADKIPMESECKTIPKGLITCMREINEALVRKLGSEIPEQDIQEIMVTGTSDLSAKYLSIVRNQLEIFSEDIYYTLKEIGYNLDIQKISFVGGGASVMKNFGRSDMDNVDFIEEIRANAVGFEALARMSSRISQKVG